MAFTPPLHPLFALTLVAPLVSACGGDDDPGTSPIGAIHQVSYEVIPTPLYELGPLDLTLENASYAQREAFTVEIQTAILPDLIAAVGLSDQMLDTELTPGGFQLVTNPSLQSRLMATDADAEALAAGIGYVFSQWSVLVTDFSDTAGDTGFAVWVLPRRSKSRKPSARAKNPRVVAEITPISRVYYPITSPSGTREIMNKTTTSFKASIRLLAGLTALLGCKPDDGGNSEDDAVAACAAAESKAACEAVSTPTYWCAWVQTVTVTAEAPCESSEELQCVPYAKGGGTPGCAPSPGCHDSDPNQPGMLVKPAYREDESGFFQLVNECGGDALGFTRCNSGATADADVQACACVCESAP